MPDYLSLLPVLNARLVGDFQLGDPDDRRTIYGGDGILTTADNTGEWDFSITGSEQLEDESGDPDGQNWTYRLEAKAESISSGVFLPGTQYTITAGVARIHDDNQQSASTSPSNPFAGRGDIYGQVAVGDAASGAAFASIPWRSNIAKTTVRRVAFPYTEFPAPGSRWGFEPPQQPAIQARIRAKTPGVEIRATFETEVTYEWEDANFNFGYDDTHTITVSAAADSQAPHITEPALVYDGYYEATGQWDDVGAPAFAPPDLVYFFISAIKVTVTVERKLADGSWREMPDSEYVIEHRTRERAKAFPEYEIERYDGGNFRALGYRTINYVKHYRSESHGALLLREIASDTLTGAVRRIPGSAGVRNHPASVLGSVTHDPEVTITGGSASPDSFADTAFFVPQNLLFPDYDTFEKTQVTQSEVQFAGNVSGRTLAN